MGQLNNSDLQPNPGIYTKNYSEKSVLTCPKPPESSNNPVGRQKEKSDTAHTDLTRLLAHSRFYISEASHGKVLFILINTHVIRKNGTGTTKVDRLQIHVRSVNGHI